MRRLGNASGVALRSCSALHFVLGLTISLLIVVELMPFDFTVSREEIAAKYAENKIRLIPFADLAAEGGAAALSGKMLIKAFCYGPLGFLLALGRDPRRAIRWGWSCGSWLGSRFPRGVAPTVRVHSHLRYDRYHSRSDGSGPGDGTSGICFVDCWHRGLSDGRKCNGYRPDWLFPLAWSRICWLARRDSVFSLESSSISRRTQHGFRADSHVFPLHGLRRFSWLPVVDYYWGNKYNALDQFFRKAFSFMPFGVLVALGQRQLYQAGMVWTVLLSAFAIGAFHREWGRYFLAFLVARAAPIC